jgi:hypothetical protein
MGWRTRDARTGMGSLDGFVELTGRAMRSGHLGMLSTPWDITPLVTVMK